MATDSLQEPARSSQCIASHLLSASRFACTDFHQGKSSGSGDKASANLFPKTAINPVDKSNWQKEISHDRS